jgi:hypothetical protein
MEVTLFKNIFDKETAYIVDVTKVFERIRNSKHIEIIKKIRFLKHKQDGGQEIQSLKKQLPVICFSGTFNRRTSANIISHSGLICLDFDHFENEEILKDNREKLIADKYTFACFLSPSGDGLKCVVKIPPERDNHKKYFEALEKYYNNKYFDISGSDIVRACFESFDPDIFINENSETFTEIIIEEVAELGTNVPRVAVNSQNRIIENLLKWFNSKYRVASGVRNNNLFKLAIAFNDFGVQKIEAENVLNYYLEKGFDKKELEAILNSAYRNTANFGTKFFEDTLLKDKLQKAVRSGKSIKEIKKDFKEFNEEDITTALSDVRETLAITDFWNYDKNGKISLSHHNFKFFLEERNFFKFYPQASGSYIFVKVEQNLIDDIFVPQIKDFTLKYLEGRTDIGYAPFDFMANNTKYFKEDYLSFLKTTEVALMEDTLDTCYLYFKNSAVKITKNNVEKISYIDLDGYIWKKHVIDRNYEEDDDVESVFQKFIYLISGENQERFLSLVSVIGYLLHSHKTPANNKAIILNDETISENPNGGSGKGLFWNAISHMKKVSSIDGKQFDFNKSFPYQTVSPDTQILVFDDVQKNFSFENLFSLITEGITIEKKNKDAIKIPVSASPKIVITTNYTIKGVGGSFERRKFEVELSSYFGAHRTPLDVFGHLLFDEWNDIEWRRFDNFMIYCVKYYLAHGLVSQEYQNLEIRKFINETSFEFNEWCEDGNLPVNSRLSKAEKYQEFIEAYPDYKKYLSQKRFTKFIEYYGKYKSYIITQGNSNGIRWVQINTNNKTENDNITAVPEGDF